MHSFGYSCLIFIFNYLWHVFAYIQSRRDLCKQIALKSSFPSSLFALFKDPILWFYLFIDFLSSIIASRELVFSFCDSNFLLITWIWPLHTPSQIHNLSFLYLSLTSVWSYTSIVPHWICTMFWVPATLTSVPHKCCFYWPTLGILQQKGLPQILWI